MITLAELLTSVRYKLNDMQGAMFSDHEIANALNRASRLLYNRMGEKFIYAAVKTAKVIVDDGVGMLPRDFGAIKKVRNELGRECHPESTVNRGFTSAVALWWQDHYRIVNDELIARDGLYTIEYYKIPFDLNNKNDVSDIPENLHIYLVEIAVAVLSGNSEAAETFAQTACKSLAWGNISHVCNCGPKQLWGRGA